MRAVLLLVVGAMTGMLMGCSAMGPDCSRGGTAYKIAPATGMADHAAAAPGNQQQFSITSMATAASGCPVSAVVTQVYGTWTSSDPINVAVSSAHDATNGLATCLGATAGPVSLNFQFASTEKGTVTLTCK